MIPKNDILWLLGAFGPTVAYITFLYIRSRIREYVKTLYYYVDSNGKLRIGRRKKKKNFTPNTQGKKWAK